MQFNPSGEPTDKRKTSLGDVLKPLFDVIQHIHGDGIDHRHLPVIILEDEHHIKILEMESNSLEVNELHFFKRYDEWRLRRHWRFGLVTDTGSFFVLFQLTHSVRLTRHPEVGCKRTVLRNGTPGKPSSRKGASNSTSFLVIAST